MQPDQTQLEETVESIGDQLAASVEAGKARVVEVPLAAMTADDAARIGAARGRHGFITEIQL